MHRLIVITGCAGSGKTSLANKLKIVLNNCVVISFDYILEGLFDTHGFSNLHEKEILRENCWDLFYTKLDYTMKNKYENIIIEYPFSNKQKNKIENIIKKHKFQTYIIRILGDELLYYNKAKIRDISENRHIGHISTKYEKGISDLANREDTKLLQSEEEFSNHCKIREYQKFDLEGRNKLIEINNQTNDLDNNLSYILNEIIGGL